MSRNCAQERPIRADALLATADALVSLAALADSADYLADVIGRSGAMDVPSASAAPAAGASGSGTPRSAGAGAGKQLSGMLTKGMAHLMDRCSWGALYCASPACPSSLNALAGNQQASNMRCKCMLG